MNINNLYDRTSKTHLSVIRFNDLTGSVGFIIENVWPSNCDQMNLNTNIFVLFFSLLLKSLNNCNFIKHYTLTKLTSCLLNS